jgi:hypothetical protein
MIMIRLQFNFRQVKLCVAAKDSISSVASFEAGLFHHNALDQVPLSKMRRSKA